jgi:hypothetical protein
MVLSCGQNQNNKHSPEQTQTNYEGLINKHIKSDLVSGFLTTLGSEYEYDDAYERKFYIYENN